MSLFQATEVHKQICYHISAATSGTTITLMTQLSNRYFTFLMVRGEKNCYCPLLQEEVKLYFGNIAYSLVMYVWLINKLFKE